MLCVHGRPLHPPPGDRYRILSKIHTLALAIVVCEKQQIITDTLGVSTPEYVYSFPMEVSGAQVPRYGALGRDDRLLKLQPERIANGTSKKKG